MFSQVEQLVGDRDSDLRALKGRQWDAVIDNSGFVPRWVKQSAELLKGQVGQYVYLSSISVYADNSVLGQTEDGELLELKNKNDEVRSNANYGGMKALSEDYVRASFPKASTLVRSGLVVGPGDVTDRFTYWPVRAHRGGEILAPGTPKDPIQCIDVRDLTTWMIKAIESQHYGTYNVTGPYHQLTMGEFLKTTLETTHSAGRLTWVPADFLDQEGVRPWTDLPLWVPPSSAMRGFVRVDIKKAVKADLKFRPIATTIQDSLAWHRTLVAKRPLKSGLSAGREAEVLRRWHTRSTDF